jgi:hypothetical protein
MDTIPVLKFLNKKASVEYRKGQLEEAGDTAAQAVNYFVTTLSSLNRGQVDTSDNLVRSQARVSALILRKIGMKYACLGEQRDDDDLLEIGRQMIRRSVIALKLASVEERSHRRSCETATAAANCPSNSPSDRKQLADDGRAEVDPLSPAA